MFGMDKDSYIIADMNLKDWMGNQWITREQRIKRLTIVGPIEEMERCLNWARDLILTNCAYCLLSAGLWS